MPVRGTMASPSLFSYSMSGDGRGLPFPFPLPCYLRIAAHSSSLVVVAVAHSKQVEREPITVYLNTVSAVCPILADFS